jgi:cell division protein ZapA
VAEETTSIRVDIYDESYHLRGSDPAYIKHVAEIVDGKMRAVAQHTSTVDSLRVAVLAALNIADECFRQKEALGKAGSTTRQKANRLATELAAAIGE